METEPWVDQKQSIWKLLPLHPLPQPLESITSYLTRLAEANMSHPEFWGRVW